MGWCRQGLLSSAEVNLLALAAFEEQLTEVGLQQLALGL